jgi:hypothetical protein
MKLFARGSVLAASLTVLMFPLSAYAIEWVQANPPASCADVCRGAGKSPVSPGNNVNQVPFYVCAGKTGEELRPGFNIAPSVEKLCTFELGGNQSNSADYKCLCN